MVVPINTIMAGEAHQRVYCGKVTTLDADSNVDGDVVGSAD